MQKTKKRIAGPDLREGCGLRKKRDYNSTQQQEGLAKSSKGETAEEDWVR